MPRVSREPPNACPQIDSVAEHNSTPEFAENLINRCAKHLTMGQVAAHVGVSRRYLSYMRHRGIKSYPIQIALEIVAGIKVLKD